VRLLDLARVTKMIWTKSNYDAGRRFSSAFALTPLVLLASLSLVSLASGFSDPWGDNLRPKLHTDYLSQFSGKAAILMT